MKKLIYSIFALCLTAMVSCSKDEIGGTATQSLAGQWYVTVDAVDDNGEVVYSDDELFGIGRFIALTFNTASNSESEMWVSDNDNFWGYKVKVKCNTNQLVFGNTDYVENFSDSEDCKVLITDGKMVPGGYTTPSGQPADYMEYYVVFDNDDYPDMLGYAKYKVSGYRYTGFVADDE